ncbi:MAG TPA: hypothetical protein PLZ51_04835, partial [Aggregatilineales bacterium]|nr:hypothetical protein [Aggregatilineales bacterium]
MGNIIRAWQEGIGSLSPKAWNEYNRMIAQDLLDAGITPVQVTAFLTSDFWRGKAPSLAKVAEQITAWLAQQKPAPV